MPKFCGEPNFHELLNDPLIEVMMRADRVDPLALRHLLGAVADDVQSPARQAVHCSDPATRTLGRWIRSQICGGC